MNYTITVVLAMMMIAKENSPKLKNRKTSTNTRRTRRTVLPTCTIMIFDSTESFLPDESLNRLSHRRSELEKKREVFLL